MTGATSGCNTRKFDVTCSHKNWLNVHILRDPGAVRQAVTGPDGLPLGRQGWVGQGERENWIQYYKGEMRRASVDPCRPTFQLMI